MDSCNYNILLAEDERLVRFILSSFFKKCGCHVDEAKNGSEALNLFQVNYYDMILMDVNMPVMDGLDATSQIRNLEKFKSNKTYIVGISSDEHNKDKCLEHGMDEFYPKPLMVQDIFKLIGK